MNLENPFQVRIFYDSTFMSQRATREKKKEKKSEAAQRRQRKNKQR